ncbi:IspD/TarI family cytidylyltransferase, partial [Alistipes sp. CHKCI003]|uniref:IspD/TarI family cytidylyltransferase n=1 Tax=Alistipes sp. CHKCI003 TaxID=1780376 RepID=UPI000A9613A9
MTARTGVIVVAGGSGRRLGGDVPKQFRLLGGMPVLARTINALAAALPGAPIVAVLPEAHIAYWRNLAARFDVARHTVAAGGAERFHSVRNGLAALPETVELIAVHDGVRPMASAELIRRTTEAAATHGAAVP